MIGLLFNFRSLAEEFTSVRLIAAVDTVERNNQPALS